MWVVIQGFFSITIIVAVFFIIVTVFVAVIIVTVFVAMVVVVIVSSMVVMSFMTVASHHDMEFKVGWVCESIFALSLNVKSHVAHWWVFPSI